MKQTIILTECTSDQGQIIIFWTLCKFISREIIMVDGSKEKKRLTSRKMVICNYRDDEHTIGKCEGSDCKHIVLEKMYLYVNHNLRAQSQFVAPNQ